MRKYANVQTGGSTKGKPKIFILDTNIILHDYNSIRKFQDNDIVIPIAVIEELDKFKKGNDALSYNARGFMREIDHLTEGRLFGNHGVPIGKRLGFIKIEPNHPFPEKLKNLFIDDIQDHRILSTAIWVRDNNPDRFVALVTKDINLHNLRYGPENAIEWNRLYPKEPKANQLYIIGTGNDNVLARYDFKSKRIILVKSRTAYGIQARNDEQKFALDACMNPDIPLVSLTGGAGTGKTLIALASALEQAGQYKQIILTRPTVILGNQDIGFLPGDENKKMSPFLQPLMDNLNVIKAQFRPTSKEALKIEAMLKEEKLLISPLAYIRGRSLGNVYFIIDEAQNLTPHEIKTVITRAGQGTKMVFTGDILQIDQPYLDQWSNGLTHIGEKLDGQSLFEHVFLRKGERSELSEIAAKLL